MLAVFAEGGAAAELRIEPTSLCECIATPSTVTLPESTLRDVVPLSVETGVGFGGDRLGIVDVHMVRRSLHAKLSFRSAVADKTRQGDFASAGLARQVLDHGFRAVKMYGAVGVREAIRQARKMERRVLQLQPAVDYRLRCASGYRRVQRNRTGREDIVTECFHGFELDIAIGPQVERMRIFDGRRPADCQIRGRPG